MFLPECVHLDSDFCYVPDQMSYVSHTWRNAPSRGGRGLAVLSEDSKEEESDRDYVEMKKKKVREEPARAPDLRRRLPRRFLVLILFAVAILFLIFFWKKTSPRAEKPTVSSQRQKKLDEGFFCSNYTLVKLEESGSYVYSAEVVIPVNFSSSSEVNGFYTVGNQEVDDLRFQTFSENGKIMESPRFVEISNRKQNNFFWRATQTGHLKSEPIVDYYLLTFFVESQTISKVSYKIGCSEREVRRMIEETATRQEEGRRAVDDWIIQTLLCILTFVIGIVAASWLPIQ